MKHALKERITAFAANGRSILVWGLLAALLIGVSDFGAPIDDILQGMRNKTRAHDASGEIAIVNIDAKAEQEIGPWPWSYQQLGALVTRLDKAGAKRIFFMFPTPERKSAAENLALEDALKNSKAKIFLNAGFEIDPNNGKQKYFVPHENFLSHVGLVNTNFLIKAFGNAPDMPFRFTVGDLNIPSLPAKLANIENSEQKAFPIDYSIRSESVPSISAAAALLTKVPPANLVNKDVIVGQSVTPEQKRYWIMGSGPTTAPIISAIAAETLKSGVPVGYGFLPALAFAWIMSFLIFNTKKAFLRRMALVGTPAMLLFVPIWLEARGVYIQIFPALLLYIAAGTSTLWSRYVQRYKRRGMHNDISGLPNLNALRDMDVSGEFMLVAARIQNYVEIIATLPSTLEAEFVKQVTGRLAFGTGGETLFQGDDGIFFWRVPVAQQSDLTDQLSALQAIFRNPVPMGTQRFDLDIRFGVDADSERTISSRMSSALLAVQGANESGTHWKFYDPSDQQATAWKLSMLGELDLAIDNGDLWVAFQPKLDLRSGRITGAEALVRWTHATQGDIRPDDFVLAAEKHNRIGKLTEFVLQKSLDLAEMLNSDDHHFQISVNLSPRLLDEPGLIDMINSAFSGRTLAMDRLMFEVTETAAISSSRDALSKLYRLRDMGIGISIDDYGTGFSTLDYLKKCPAAELKIDRGFVHTLVSSNSDRIMVNSTIELAHSLGQIVVAEGVEDMNTLNHLKDMGCDMAQGYLIGRPMQIEALLVYLQKHGVRFAA